MRERPWARVDRFQARRGRDRREGAELDTQLEVQAPDCRIQIKGTAFQRGTRDVFNGGEVREPCLLTIGFNDAGAEINLYSCRDAGCEGFNDTVAWGGPAFKP